ncbi:nucleotidyltransferase domain-containing protein [Pseudomonas solani]|uniref:nucleotidyltransferase domain-containing protein n=1 Tax=Pseudomonas solani TaxID=2731552 RepID=UPI0035BE86DA
MNIPPGLLDLRYFGSIVRNDSDNASDADILCVVDNKEDANLENLHKLFDKKIIKEREIDLSVYGKDRISEMYDEGHLFAWHIYQESIPAHSDFSFISELGKPKDYVKAVEDIERLLEVLQDTRSSLSDKNCSIVYEAGLLYVVGRNIGISASWYSDNGLDFSRNAPYTLMIQGENRALPLGKHLYGMLCAARHASVRGSPSPLIEWGAALDACTLIEQWGVRLIADIEVIS